MKNNYLLECSDSIALEEKIHDLVSKMGFLDAYQASYDLEDTLLDRALEDLDTYGFFTNKKVIIIKNVFTNGKDKKLEELLYYLDHSYQDNLLILTTSQLDQRLSIVKQMKKSSNIEVMHIELNPVSYATNLLKKYDISSSNIRFLVQLCQNDISRINSECQKLMNFKYEEKEITHDDIEQMVVKKLGDSNEILFSFIRYLLLKDKKKAYQLYLELIHYQIDIYSIIGLMSSQIRLTHQVKILSEDNMTNQEIASILHLKSPYQVKKVREYIPYYTYDQIYDFVKKLSDIDYDIKSGRVDSSLALDMLIMNI